MESSIGRVGTRNHSLSHPCCMAHNAHDSAYRDLFPACEGVKSKLSMNNRESTRMSTRSRLFFDSPSLNQHCHTTREVKPWCGGQAEGGGCRTLVMNADDVGRLLDSGDVMCILSSDPLAGTQGIGLATLLSCVQR